MFDKIITYSVKNKFIIGLGVFALILWGIFSLSRLPIDAVPDITNNQVQIITISPTLATQEIEQFITAPIELSLQNLQHKEEIRSISRFGLSVITVVFEEEYDLYLARQLVADLLKEAEANIPEGLGTPELAPISTGLGEIYQYNLRVDEAHKDDYSLADLRSIQDWVVKRQLAGIEGVIEINSLGGFLKQYEVSIDPNLLKSRGISIIDIFDALENSNENTGGAYIEKNSSALYIRSQGLATSLEDIGNIVISDEGTVPLLIKNVAKVQYGNAPRYGALVGHGEEVVGAKVMMFKGANSAKVTEEIKARIIEIQKSMPPGVTIEPFLVRDKLIDMAISTVKTNLLEGGLIVVFILVLFLGNWRAGLIVASVIPLAMLFAVSMMNLLGISANLMSLGAIDFGLIVDGAVIIVEAIIHRLYVNHKGKQLTASQMDDEVLGASLKIRSSAAFGEIIILMVYIPILALVGIEGKMFKPMAQTVMLAISGALILSLTYVPMMSALLLSKKIIDKETFSDKLIAFFYKLYAPILTLALRLKIVFVIGVIALFAFSAFIFGTLGGEFIPTLEEGDLAMHQILPPGSSLSQSVTTAELIEHKLMEEFPEIENLVVNIGSAEIPTDPMPVEIGDFILVMKPMDEWTSASNRKELYEKLEKILKDIPGVGYEFSQPIQMRFNELMTGSKSDIAIKLYGENLDTLFVKAQLAEAIIKTITGVASVNVEQLLGMPQIFVDFDYKKMAQYGLHVKEVNKIIRASFAGEKAGVIYEGEKRFDLVVRMDESFRTSIEDVKNLLISLNNGSQIPLSTVADVKLVDAPLQISRDNTNRRVTIGVNVGNTDVETLVTKIQKKLDAGLNLPSGYYLTYGGQFENLKTANKRLMIALPIALAMIFILLFFTFHSLSQAVLIFATIPLSAIGGIWALYLRGMPFSISAGIGFIALFGVAVLNGIVLIGYFNQLKKEGMTDVAKRIKIGTTVRLRPVLMTAAVASLGFLPMALSNSGGAEVQRPLATVVIGGLFTATFLTLIILPIFYSWLAKWEDKRTAKSNSLMTVVVLAVAICATNTNYGQKVITLDSAIAIGVKNHPSIVSADYEIERAQLLAKQKYNPGTTNFSYQGNGLYRENGNLMHQFGAVQNIANPGKVKALNRVTSLGVETSELNRNATVLDLEYQIKNLYYELQFEKSMRAANVSTKLMYATFLEMAETRVKVGAANNLEKLTIQTKYDAATWSVKNSVDRIENLEVQLQLLLVVDEKITTADSLQPIQYQMDNEWKTLWFLQAENKSMMETQKIHLAKAQYKPNFNVGYNLQNYYQGGMLSGIQVGVNVPLFRGQIKQQVQAQTIQSEIAKNNLSVLEIELKHQKLNAKSQIERSGKELEFYKKLLATTNPELLQIASLNYKAGEISYLELLNVLDIVANNESNYLVQLLKYNQSIIYYQYISANFETTK